jgi:crotonobetainyl-CoA:carnitine CoA-transferase CaiB-like acyl-CoA transferase
VGGDEQWRDLCATLHTPELAAPPLHTATGRRDHETVVRHGLAQAVRTQNGPALETSLQRLGIAAARLQVPSDFLTSDVRPGFISVTDHPLTGPTAWLSPVAPALRLSPPTIPAPLLGQQTDEILHERLGLSGPDISALRARGVLR